MKIFHLLGDTFLLEDAKIEQEPLVNEELLREIVIELDNFDTSQVIFLKII